MSGDESGTYVPTNEGRSPSGRKRGRRALRAIGKAVRELRAGATVATLGEMRRSFRDGDLLLFKGKGLISTIIRAVTRSPYSHAGLVYTFEKRVYCIESVGTGVRIILLSELVKRYHGGIDYFEVDVSARQRRRAVSFGFQQLGKFYDKLGLIRFAAALLWDKKAVSARDDRWFCSELVAAAYELQGAPLTTQGDAYTSPSDLAMSPRVKLVCTLKEAEEPEPEVSDDEAEAPALAPCVDASEGVPGVRVELDQM